jgi:putative peptide zinc metalloprotease protein
LLLLLVPFPVYVVADGIVWNEGVTPVYSPADGLLQVSAPAGTTSGSVIELDNPELRSALVELRAEREALRIAARRVRAEAPEKADSFDERLQAVSSQITAIMKEMSNWRMEIPEHAVWHPLRATSMTSTWLRRDDPRPLGLAIAAGPLFLRVFVDQWDGPAALATLAGSTGRALPVRRRGETKASFSAVVVQLPSQARDELPSLALSTAGGGRIPVRADARDVQRPTERVFEVRLAPITAPADALLDHGARVEVLIQLESASLASIAWRRARQALQRHLKV